MATKRVNKSLHKKKNYVVTKCCQTNDQSQSLNGNADVDLSATSCYRQNANAAVCPTAEKEKSLNPRTKE